MADDPRPVPAWAERWVRLLDDGFRIPGTQVRIGLDAVLGFLLPEVGDALSVVSSFSLLALAYRRGVPRTVLLRMAINVAIDALIGAIPLLGDVFDVAWKAQRKNLELIERASPSSRGEKRAATLGDRLFIGLVLLTLLGVVLLPLVLSIWLLQELFTSSAR